MVEKILKESIRLNELLLDSLPHPAMLINKKRLILAANKIARDAGVEIGEFCWDTFGHCDCLCQEHHQRLNDDPDCMKDDILCTFCLANELIETGTTQNDPEVSAFGKIWDTWWVPVEDGIFLHYAIDITQRKKAEKQQIKLNEILEDKVKERTAELEDLNAALKVLLNKRDEDKKEVEKKIFTNYESLISPFLQKLKNSLTKKDQLVLIDILESNMKELLEPFSIKISDPMKGLTPAEIQIAAMVKKGFSNKEIAQTLNNSLRTITNHRDHIRKKLGLLNKKINLQSFLSAL